MKSKTIQERFGDPIGSYAGDPPVGVRSEGEVCQHCGMLPVDGKCGCESGCSCMNEQESCPVHSKSETAEAKVCEECGMMEIDEQCGCAHLDESELEEVTPAGYEKVVKALKKDPDIESPWAIAWSMKKKGIEPKE